MNQHEALLKVINSDKFLEMRFTTQLLFFRCVSEVDDDGKINCVKALKRLIGASDGDIQELVDERLIIPVSPRIPDNDVSEYIVPVMSKAFSEEGE